MRQRDRELEAERLRIFIEQGIDVREVEVEDLSEVLHWIQFGRGKPYV